MNEDALSCERRFRSKIAESIVNMSLLLSRTEFMWNSALSNISYFASSPDDARLQTRALVLSPTRFEHRPYLRLGVTLAEIGIGRDIQIYCGERGQAET